jgi:hypothetical protein
MSLPREVVSEMAKIEDARQRAARRAVHSVPAATAASGIFSAEELMARVFPEPRWAVPGILTEGVSILAGKPKLGKSWLALNVAVAVACGGRALGVIEVDAGPVLYLALEDGQKRLQDRLRKTLAGDPIPKNLFLQTEWKCFDDGGLLLLKEWLQDHSDARLIVIDTLKRVRPHERANGRLYDGDYDSIGPLGDLARAHNCAVLVVHHTRKMDSDDPLDLVSGSLGLTGAADGVLVLKRVRGEADAVLHATGRDFEDKEIALRWDAELTVWRMLGDAAEYRLSNERREVIALLKKSGPLGPKAVADSLGRKQGACKKLLWHMHRDGELHADGGRYSLPVTMRDEIYFPPGASDDEIDAICDRL